VQATAADRRHWREGVRDFEQRNYARALAAWRLCRAGGTEAAQAEALLRLALSSRRPGEAVSLLREAVALVPGDALYRYHLALALWRGGAADEAIALAGAAAAAAGPDLAPRIAAHEALMRRLAAREVAAARDGAAADLGTAEAVADALPRALAALASGRWAEAAAHAEAAAAGDLPPAYRDLARWAQLEAHAALGRWHAVLSAVPPEGRLGERVRAWQRFAAASIWVHAVAAGDAASAAAMLPRLASGLPPELRRRAAAVVGAAAAARGDWASAVRHFAGAGDRAAQPLALASERLGNEREAADGWARVWDALRSGAVPPGIAALPRGVTSGTAAARAVELLLGAGQGERALALLERALATPGTELPGPFCVRAARLLLSQHEEPGPAWRQAASLLEAGLREAPEDVAAWAQLATLRRRMGSPAAALEAVRRGLALAPERFAFPFVEATGSAMLEAWQAGDLDGAERLTATLTDPAVGLPPSALGVARMLAELASGVWERARHRPQAGSITRWDRVLHRFEPGWQAPLAAYVFRGTLSLLRGGEAAAERHFTRLRRAEYWRQSLPQEALPLAAYCRSIWFAHCWARQVRGEAGRAPACAGSCGRAFVWLALGTAATVDMDPGAAPEPQEPPAAIAGCPHMREMYAGWVETRPALRLSLLAMFESALDEEEVDALEVLLDFPRPLAEAFGPMVPVLRATGAPHGR
jgi:tetratricopeptide (TPR) repeat protein